MGWLIGTSMGLAIAVALHGRVRGKFHRLSEPSCGKCGYCVRGIPTLVCPECGSDLREVGIVVPRFTVAQIRLLTRVLVWTLLIPLPLLACLDLFALTIGPYRMIRQRTYSLNSVIGYRSVFFELIEAHDNQMFGNVQFSTSRVLNLYLGSPQFQFKLFPRTGEYFFTDPNGHKTKQGSGFGSQAIKSWLLATQLDLADDATVQHLSADLADAIQQFDAENYTNLARSYERAMSRGTRYRVGPPQPATMPVLYGYNGGATVDRQWTVWTYLFVFGLPAAIWTAGTFVIVRRTRRTVPPIPAAA